MEKLERVMNPSNLRGTFKNTVDISILISRSEKNQAGVRIVLARKVSDAETYFLTAEL